MKYYKRNSWTKMKISLDKVIITGGRYNKKFILPQVMQKLLLMTFQSISEIDLLDRFNKITKISSDDFYRIMSKLVDAGFIDEDVVYNSFAEKLKLPEYKAIDTFNIPTCNRLGSVKRCLESYSNHFKIFRHELVYNIFDDSSIEKFPGMIKMLENISKEKEIKINYIGVKEKNDFVNLLAQNIDIDRKILDFAFMPKKIFGNSIFSAGANRNFILAYNYGTYIFMADDDSLLSGPVNKKSSGLIFSEGRGEVNKSFVDSKNINTLNKIIEEDIYKWHLNFLGNELKDVLYINKIDRITCNNLGIENKIFPNEYKRYESSTIDFTYNLIAGWPDETADEVLSKSIQYGNRNYIEGKSNRIIKEYLPKDAIYSNPFLLTTTLTGMNVRNGLLPFIPIFRNEDVHFSYLLNYLKPNALAACNSLPLLHDKKINSNQFKCFFDNFYGDIVFTTELYGLIRKIYLDVDIKYLSQKSRILLFAEYIKNICADSTEQFVKNLININNDLKYIYTQKQELINVVFHKFNIAKDSYINAKEFNFMSNYKNFLKNDSWNIIRKVLLYYSDLVVAWHKIMEVSCQIKKDGRLPMCCI